MAGIIEKLILLTIEEVEMYPSIQAKIWGSIGQVPELIDMVLDNFIHRSVNSGLGSPMVEIMADTAVALASANVPLVAKKIIGRLCRVIKKVRVYRGCLTLALTRIFTECLSSYFPKVLTCRTSQNVIYFCTYTVEVLQ